MRRSVCILLFATLSFIPLCIIAGDRFGMRASYLIVSHEVSSLNGYQAMLTYEPSAFRWCPYQLYFEGGFSHFWVNTTPYYTILNIYSAAPVFRYYFPPQPFLKPYFEASLGFAYLNHTHLDDRNLGMHFAFQDWLGVGAIIGKTNQLSIGMHAVHYSNGHLCGHNSGFTLPIVLDMGLRFN